MTSSSTFLTSTFGVGLDVFPRGARVTEAGSSAEVAGGAQCDSFLVSDVASVFCGSGGSVLEIASDGTVTTLGTLLNEGLTAGAGGLAFEHTYVY